ncbi:MAG TPA: efflux RND transporter periplasmic adaptor subunit [Gemmatimonadaceae bacterium]|nr:efflux RND transporter periplasmic adaptor subunit [Gemmatimonadaceae bacterium]
MRHIQRILLIAIAASSACNKTDAPSKTELADMPGMKPGSDSATKGGAGSVAIALDLTAAQIQHGGVKWGAVAMGNATTRAAMPGTVIPDEDRTARLGAPARGRVIDVKVRPGDRVARDQVLVTLQSTEAGMAQSDVSKAAAEVTSRKAQVQYAAAAKARAERLMVLKAIPRQDYERAVADDEQARASLLQAESELGRARGTAEQLGAGGLSSTGEIAIRSPLAGVVLARLAVPGAVVDAGAPLVAVTDPTSLWLSINAPEQFVGLFRTGDVVRFAVPAFPADTFAARIDAVGAGLDAETRTLAVRGTVTSVARGTSRLRSEMLANVVVDGGPVARAAIVPEDAVQMVQGKPCVFIVRPDAKGGAHFERREVELGSRANGHAAVLRGLAAGDIIVTDGAFAVKAEFQRATMPKMEM